MRSILFLISLACANAAPAQVSLEDLDAVARAAESSMEEFRKRLNDPDPDRALAVLQLLIREGDADQRRLAIRHGLQSTDRAIQATTIRSILDAKPNLRVVFDPVSEEDNVYYARAINAANGVIDEQGNGSVTFKITGHDKENDCWTHTSYNSCLARMRGDEFSLWFGDSWGSYRLNGSGQLVGQQAVSGQLCNATIELSE